MGALTSPVMVASGRRTWLRNVAALTVAGLVTSVLLGMTLGYIGEALNIGAAGVSGVVFVMVLALLAIARETRWTTLPLLEARRQTPRMWGSSLGLHAAAWLWGLDVGLFFTTWLTFAGVWLIPLLALLSGSPTFGIAVFAAYWAGRVLSVWLAPVLVTSATDAPRLMAALRVHYRTGQLVHAGIVMWVVTVLALMTTQSVSI